MGDGMCIRDALANLKTFGDCYHEDCPTNSKVKEAMALVDERREELNKKKLIHIVLVLTIFAQHQSKSRPPL